MASMGTSLLLYAIFLIRIFKTALVSLNQNDCVGTFLNAPPTVKQGLVIFF